MKTKVRDKVALTLKRLMDKGQAYFCTKKWQEGVREADNSAVAY